MNEGLYCQLTHWDRALAPRKLLHEGAKDRAGEGADYA